MRKILKRASYSGNTRASQARDGGSIPLARSVRFRSSHIIDGMGFAGFAVLLLFLAGCAAPTAYIPATATYDAPENRGVYHTIERGQTLWGISKLYGADLDELLALNRITDVSRISAGQKIFIPGLKSSKKMPAYTEARGDDGAFTWPVNGKVLLTFGSRHYDMVNKGVDIIVEPGEDVRSSRAGTVSFIDEDFEGYGETIIVDHGDGFSTVYAYNSKILAKVGDNIAKRQVIAKAGSSGRADAPLLHFEIRKRHKPENPFYYLP